MEKPSYKMCVGRQGAACPLLGFEADSVEELLSILEWLKEELQDVCEVEQLLPKLNSMIDKEQHNGADSELR